jgi:hypothetical protein
MFLESCTDFAVRTEAAARSLLFQAKTSIAATQARKPG